MSERGDQRATYDRRAGTVLGWLAGASLGLVIDYAAAATIGDAYPAGYSTFTLVVLGAFAGMAIADRLGPRAPKVLGPVAGVLVTVCVTLFLGATLLR